MVPGVAGRASVPPRSRSSTEGSRPRSGIAPFYCTHVAFLPITGSNPPNLPPGLGPIAANRSVQSTEESMTYAETLLPEFGQEMANPRKVLERLPDDKLDWQAHPKSHTIGWNANHVADMPKWMAAVLTTP